ncbi:hypothetical protein F4778DRAFT_289995 [Xylariomycetidae sp. FL2044]|nr:hypothetical protein F4778DRAFT_289995 [Xylariomycetidae sp. FL2044]
METLRLKPRQPVEDMVENWDDDDFMIDNDDLTFRTNSTTANTQSNRRDSHASFRSDRESLPGHEEQHVHLPGDDEKSTLDAIAAATHAGIPIPPNVPPSALMGGTIKRLGGRKLKKIFQEDWDEDLELPAPGQALRLKAQDGAKFPDVLRQVSGSASTSPAKQAVLTIAPFPTPKDNRPVTLAAPINLDRFRDTDDDDDVFGDGSVTIKAPKLPIQSKPMLITPPTPSPIKKKRGEEDDFENDLELPSDGKLKLSRRRDIPKTPSLNTNDDFDWGEGSLGTRFGGTKRDAFSNRSSSASALSPSIASSITAESEDETFDGLVLPNGPLDLGERLKRRKDSRSPERIESSESEKRPKSSKTALQQLGGDEDHFSGLDLGDGDPLRSGKLTLHRNIKVKATRQSSPSRPKTAVSITFTNKPVPPNVSRLPRPMVSHERSHTQSSLEPVSESGGPIPQRPARRSQSRLGHSAQSSISSVHTPTTPSNPINLPSTPRRRELGQKASTGTLRNEPTTTSAQLLRLKRSLPVMRNPQSPAKPASTAQSRRNQVPFLPAGASQNQSQNVLAKTSRAFRRHDSDHGPELRPLSRAVSRSTVRSPSPRRSRQEKSTAEPVWQQINKPRRLRQFGDGHELDAFDDLPTSAQVESKYTKQPIATGNRGNIRNKIYQNVLPDRNTPSPVSPYSPARVDYQPHFARDTAASRMAREASLAQRALPSGPLAPLTTQRVAQLSTRTNLNPHTPLHRSKKSRKLPQTKPHLIANLNPVKEPKVVNGMTYNPVTYVWEGNENALNAFDVPASSPSTASLPPYMMREKESSTPRPLLIKDMSASKGVKRVGEMIFDPQAMCWLKAGALTPTTLRSDDPMEGFNALDDDDDPFKDIPDLEDKDKDSTEGGHGRVSDIREEWLVGEEFDVGPEFIRRQREEEDRWRKKCERWGGAGGDDRTAMRWAIRDMIMGG